MTELFVILGAAGRVHFITTRRCEKKKRRTSRGRRRRYR